MTRKVQARTLATRDRLLSAGREIAQSAGLAGLRTDEVVLRAGTAKGTFFAHFPDRDHFLAALLAESLTADLANLAPPTDRDTLRATLDRVFLAFAADAETVALLARFSGPAGVGLGLDLMICAVIDRLALGLGAMQAQGLVANRAPPQVLAEGLLALVFHAAASAQCPVVAQGDSLAVRARAGQLLRDMTEALIWPKV
ncbi:MAG: TetR/AcrR family transcriptional regulator [Rhodobacterales bacterium]|nr:MAG: TetR/AcrR family transcriptional regulator [Rhodobacterales bacterium]